MWKIAGLKPKRGGFRGKNAAKAGKTIFRISADNEQKGVRNGCFGRRNGQNGRRKGVFRAS